MRCSVSTPQRIQLSRKRGWRKPEGAIVVSRPGKWGNPYRLDDYRADYPVDYPGASEHELRRMAVSDFRGLVEGRWGRLDDVAEYPSLDEICSELAGKDLCCWCPLEDAQGNRVPCHADVLLEFANGAAS